MPIYEYRCSKCGNTVERLQRMSDPELKMNCHLCENGGDVTRVFSKPALKFVGSGFYETDYKNK